MELTLEQAVEQFEDNGMIAILQKGVWSAEDVAEIQAHVTHILMFFDQADKAV